MTTRFAALCVLLGYVLVTSACAARPPATTGTVTAIDIRGVVGPDGRLDVVERIDVAPVADAVRFTRTVRTPFADAAVFASAVVDGQSVLPGDGRFDVVDDGSAFSATWQVAPVQAPVALQLNYAIASAVGVRQPRGRLEWPVLEAARDFAVDQVTVTLDVPQGSHVYDGTGMAEAGWQIEVADGRITARRANVPANEAATFLAVFDVDRAQVRQGEWEWNLDRREQYRFALISAGLFILVVGIGILVQMRVQYPPVRGDAAVEARDAARVDRVMLSRGLWVSAAAGLGVAVCAAAAAHRWLPGLGAELQAIPGSIALVAMAFGVAGWWYGRSAAAMGARQTGERSTKYKVRSTK